LAGGRRRSAGGLRRRRLRSAKPLTPYALRERHRRRDRSLDAVFSARSHARIASQTGVAALSSRPMHRPFLSAVASALVFVAPIVARADDTPTRHDLVLRVGAALGGTHASATGTLPTTNPISPLIPTQPFAEGDAYGFEARLAVAAAYEAQLLDYGAGLPRLLLGVGGTLYLGKQFDGGVTNLHGGATNDTTYSIDRPFTLDLYAGGVFPLCRTPRCVELHGFLGVALTYRTVTATTDESNSSIAGGTQTSTNNWRIEGVPLLGADLDIPLCKNCPDPKDGRPLRLRIGAYGRSWAAVHQGITTPTTRVYDVALDTIFEVDAHLGLVIPL
jgi:hypothetical protein